MNTQLPNRSAILPVALLLAASLAALATAIWPHSQAGAMAEQTESRRMLLDTMQRKISRAGKFKQQNREMRGSGDGVNLFLDGETRSLAAAALQQRILDVVEGSGGKAESYRVAETNGTAQAARVAIQLSIKTDLIGLKLVLLELERSEPMLFVDALHITSDAEAATSSTLTVEMTVSGVHSAELKS